MWTRLLLAPLIVSTTDLLAQRVPSAPWVEEARYELVGGKELLKPAILAVDRGSLYIFDSGSHELIAVSLTGQQRWRRGTKGGGPGEFENPLDIKVSETGDIVVLDGGLGRLTTYSSQGKLVTTQPVVRPLYRLGKISKDGVLGLPESGTPHLLFTGRDGSLREVPSPPELAAVGSIAQDAYTSLGANGISVLAYLWSSFVEAYDKNGKLLWKTNGVEPQPFAKMITYVTGPRKNITVNRMDPAAKPVVRAHAAGSALVFVYVDSTARRPGVMDMYDLRTGTYRSSATLPVRPHALVALQDGRLAALVNEPLPALVILRQGLRS